MCIAVGGPWSWAGHGNLGRLLLYSTYMFQFVPVKQAARISGRSARSVYHWARRGRVRIERRANTPLLVCLQDVLRLARDRPQGNPCKTLALQSSVRLRRAHHTHQERSLKFTARVAGAMPVPAASHMSENPLGGADHGEVKPQPKSAGADRDGDDGRRAVSAVTDRCNDAGDTAPSADKSRAAMVERALDRFEVRTASAALRQSARRAAERAAASIVTDGTRCREAVHRAVERVLGEAQKARTAERAAEEHKRVKRALHGRVREDARRWLPVGASDNECEQAAELLRSFIAGSEDSTDPHVYAREGPRMTREVADRVHRRLTIDRVLSSVRRMNDEDLRRLRTSLECSLARFPGAAAATLERAAYLQLERFERTMSRASLCTT